MTKTIRVLFVDNDPRFLDGLRRMFYKMRQEWDMEFVASGVEALNVLKESPCDVVVCDLHMPDMNGVELLEKVRQRHPNTIRFLLSGYSGQPLQGRAARCVYQFIPKPCDAEALQGLIHRALRLTDRLRSKAVADTLSNLNSLPVMSDTYKQVIDVLGSPSSSPREVGKMIARDIGMSAKILQLVNSPFYGSAGKIADPVHAVVYLGLKTVEALVLTGGIFSKLPRQRIKEFSVDDLQEHCVRVGSLARTICKAWHMSPNERDAASMAGILHDAGKILLISRFPREWAEARELSRNRQIPLYAAEQEILNMTHAELGGALFDLWGLPSVIIEAATYHHDCLQTVDNEFSIVLAVQIANMVDHALHCDPSNAYVPPFDETLLEGLRLTNELPQWQDLYVRC